MEMEGKKNHVSPILRPQPCTRRWKTSHYYFARKLISLAVLDPCCLPTYNLWTLCTAQGVLLLHCSDSTWQH